MLERPRERACASSRLRSGPSPANSKSKLGESDAAYEVAVGVSVGDFFGEHPAAERRESELAKHGSSQPPKKPQLIVPPQPSGSVPHCPGWQFFGVQPQTLGVPPPPQVCGAGQVSQVSVPPQPLLTTPHCPGRQVVGVQHLFVIGLQT